MATLLFDLWQQFIQQNHLAAVVDQVLIGCVWWTYTDSYAVTDHQLTQHDAQYVIRP